MGARDSGQAVRVVELLRNVLAERVPSTSRGDAPAAALIRVGPKQIAHGALLRHFLDSVELSDLIKGVNRGRQTSVQAENLVLNDSGQRQVVEQLSEDLPHVGISVLPEALVVETIPIAEKHSIL